MHSWYFYHSPLSRISERSLRFEESLNLLCFISSFQLDTQRPLEFLREARKYPVRVKLVARLIFHDSRGVSFLVSGTQMSNEVTSTTSARISPHRENRLWHSLIRFRDTLFSFDRLQISDWRHSSFIRKKLISRFIHLHSRWSHICWFLRKKRRKSRVAKNREIKGFVVLFYV